MTAHATEAVVLHSFDYLESSRIIRMLTRDMGLRSALARGARRSSKRFGSALDIYVQGVAELEVRPDRDLDTLSSFDLTRTRSGIGDDLARFTGAAALAELILRFAQADADPVLFEVTCQVLDNLSVASGDAARDATIAGAWHILAALGFGPGIDECAECGQPFGPDDLSLFSHSAGGVFCESCARQARVGRKLPASARLALRSWLEGDEAAATLTPQEARAHQRLLKEFVHEHLSDGRPMKAFDAWESDAWSAA
jgi:DNA repair protein RecO (recombination protein O)